MTASMTQTGDLDERLRRYHASLVAHFAVATATAPLPAPTAGTPPRRCRRHAVQAGVGAALVGVASLVAVRPFAGGDAGPITLHVPGYTVVAAAGAPVTPKLSRNQAIATAIATNERATASSPPDQRLIGLRVTGATFAPRVLRVWSCRAHIYLQHVENIWIVEVTAPPQHGFQSIAGALLVDDDTGSGAGGDVLLSRGQLPTCVAP